VGKGDFLVREARIIIGICLGVAIVHIALTSQREGSLSSSPWVLLLFAAMFGWFAWDGVVSGRAVLGPALLAERKTHPIGFWLVIGLWSLFAIALSLLPFWIARR